jgi:hypothetical protein
MNDKSTVWTVEIEKQSVRFSNHFRRNRERNPEKNRKKKLTVREVVDEFQFDPHDSREH